VEDLKLDAATPGMRDTILYCVAETRKVMIDAKKLPAHLKSKSLAMESAVIIRIANKLLNKLDQQDPLAVRVELTKLEKLGCGFTGVLVGLFTRKAKA